MAFFKILLIILVAAPVVVLSIYLYFQVLDFISRKNRADNPVRQGEGGRKRR